MRRYYIHVPTTLNDGSAVGPDQTAAIDIAAGKALGAYTVLHNAEGLWQGYSDTLRIFVVDHQGSEIGILSFCHFVKVLLEQECVYLADHEINTRLI